ncbi:hypothetical protein [Parasedimentitalea huanghaiensis]|uniref:Uncharacterized protein n=1 Tax=Parasedimentitalea huanghaiensis TaxID=2682100 RepID=A0A6L6WM94_9RHOB|nr:hypothetical protein [Zongyanglinia huanghaiensis]MVO17107.1 hypothetical protein [Zongyanglinia huanghaiensis]
MRKTLIAGETRPNAWVIVNGEREVGRIILDEYPNNSAAPWGWSFGVHPASNGRVDTMKEAREAVRRAVGTAVAGSDRE